MSAVEAEALARLSAHAAEMGRTSLGALFEQDKDRVSALGFDWDDWRFDLTKRRWTPAIRDDLIALARARGVFERFADQLRGVPVNGTEGRAALHTAWRDPTHAPDPNALRRELERHRRFVADADASEVDAVVNVGIGGSDLGPRLAIDALAVAAPRRRAVRFVSNIDPEAPGRALDGLNPARTMVLVVSKSFTTLETLANAQAAKSWLGDHAGARLAACTARPDLALDFGVPESAIFAFEDWVGGRFSLWSAAGLSIPLVYGHAMMDALREGAAAMDRTARDAPPDANPPFLLAALDWWSRTMLGAPGRVVAPYADALRLLPAWLQQLEMESLGKSVRADGAPLQEPSVGAVWGAPGTDCQHAFFQALHQGAEPIPVEFLGVRDSARQGPSGRALLANMIGQGAALMQGRRAADVVADLLAGGASAEDAARLAPHKTFPGDRESTTILLPRLDPETLGGLLALYEHKTAFLGYMMGINPFDQMGVELGKALARDVAQALDQGAVADADPSTQDLMRRAGGV